MAPRTIVQVLVMLVLTSAGTAAARPATTVFSTNFESGLPSEFTAPGCQIEGVQGWSGLGPAGSAFGGNFLRFSALTLSDTRLTLTGLPPHDRLDLRFMLAVIDSWDGTELFQVLVDGNLVFSHWFQLATGDASSYVPAPSALLSSGSNLGFTNGTWYQRDRAYDLSVEPALQGIPHTSSSAEIVWRISAVSGPAATQWQGGTDESWAIENVAVAVSGVAAVDDVSAPPFGLTAVASPVRAGPLRVEFSLPSRAPATLELFDTGGRRVAALDVGSQPGRHTATLAPRHDIPSGVYLLRLSQGGRTHARRVAVID